MIPTILLAAGASRRFGDGASKLLHDVNGKPLIRWTAEALDAVVPDELLVVVPPFAGKIREALDGLRVRFVENRRAEQGMGTSIAAGIAAVDERAEAVLLTLADIPFGPALVVPGLVRRYTNDGAAIVAPRYRRGVPGHPVLFARSVFPELALLDGERGARTLVEHDPSRVVTLDVDADAPADVDTPADLMMLTMRTERAPRTSR